MQTFDKLFLSEASDIAFAGEIAVMVSASSIPKLSNLFFIFLSPFVFLWDVWCPHKIFSSFWRVDKATTNQHPPKNFSFKDPEINSGWHSVEALMVWLFRPPRPASFRTCFGIFYFTLGPLQWILKQVQDDKAYFFYSQLSPFIRREGEVSHEKTSPKKSGSLKIFKMPPRYLELRYCDSSFFLGGSGFSVRPNIRIFSETFIRGFHHRLLFCWCRFGPTCGRRRSWNKFRMIFRWGSYSLTTQTSAPSIIPNLVRNLFPLPRVLPTDPETSSGWHSVETLMVWLHKPLPSARATNAPSPMEWGRSYHTKLPHIFSWEIKTKNYSNHPPNQNTNPPFA